MAVHSCFPSNLTELEKIFQMNGINCPNPGVQSLWRCTQEDSQLPKGLLQSTELRV
ncbi:hypothetical protein LDENG_00066870 [Lucifuga dentata]|nr:hypothetical protein LDENG_00066870 [Lucifuga dentata]